MSKLNSIYLSGWEYNRLLQDDPCQPRNSALPAEVLWNGATVFWLFENVYCTREALENEQCAADELGWTTGRIFNELSNEGVLIAKDWTREIEGSAKEEFKARHKAIQKDKDIKSKIRSAIARGDQRFLEERKQELLEPVLSSWNCVSGLSPNSLGVWMPPPALERLTAIGLQGWITTRLATPIKGGIKICRKPGLGLTEEERKKCEEVKRMEAEMIPDLLAGEGPFSGPRGYEAYHRELRQYRPVYEAADEILVADWKESKGRLCTLRKLADKHLWPDLHGFWLPELTKEQKDEDKKRSFRGFEEWINHAQFWKHFTKYLDMDTRFVLAMGTSVGFLLSGLMQALSPEQGRSSAPFIMATSVAGSAVAAQRLGNAKEHCGQLAMFYHKATKAMREHQEE